MLPGVTVIIPARNEEVVIGKCLEHLLLADYPKDKMEIIVAANGCTDKTVRIAKKYERKSPKVRVIDLGQKGSLAAAVNAVLPYAKNEIISVTAADFFVEPQSIRKAVKHFEQPDVIGVGGVLKPSNKDMNWMTKALAIERYFISFWEWFCNRLGRNAGAGSWGYSFIRKNVLTELGGFDETSMVEDAVMVMKLRRLYRACRVAFEPKAIAWTNEPHNFTAFWRQCYRGVRGVLNVPKISSDRPIRDKLCDYTHSLPYLSMPFGVVVGTVFAVTWLLNLHWLVVLPLFALFCFNLGLIVWSRFFFKQPLRELIWLPVWFLFANIVAYVIVPKVVFDELFKKAFTWQPIPRPA